MERILLSEVGVKEGAARAAAVLHEGGVVLYPTDTLYGLGADALSDEAVAKIFSIKGRNDGKPVHAIVADTRMATRYGEVTDQADALADAFPGKVTLIVQKRSQRDTGITRGITTFGFRIPDNAFCVALTRAFDGPITATSANISGLAPARTVENILAQLGSAADRIDLVIDAGELPECAPSTVVDLSGAAAKVLREGAVSASAIMAAL